MRQNFKLKNALNECLSGGQQIHTMHLYNEINEPVKKLEGQIAPLFTHEEINRNLADYLLQGHNKHIIFFIFSLSDCGSCVLQEIPIWNSFNKENTDQHSFQLIGITDIDNQAVLQRIINTYGIHFPVLGIKNIKQLLKNYNVNSTPVIFFTDTKSRNTIYAHSPLPTFSSAEIFVPKIRAALEKDRTRSNQN